MYVIEELAKLLDRIPSLIQSEKVSFSVFGEVIKIFGKLNFFCQENGVSQSKLFNAGLVLSYIHKMFESLQIPSLLEINRTEVPSEIKTMINRIG